MFYCVTLRRVRETTVVVESSKCYIFLRACLCACACVVVCACARIDTITLPSLVMSSKLHSENQATNRLTLFFSQRPIGHVLDGCVNFYRKCDRNVPCKTKLRTRITKQIIPAENRAHGNTRFSFKFWSFQFLFPRDSVINLLQIISHFRGISHSGYCEKYCLMGHDVSSSDGIYQRFGRIYSFHHQGLRVSLQPTDQLTKGAN
jgi:hypothetical protein